MSISPVCRFTCPFVIAILTAFLSGCGGEGSAENTEPTEAPISAEALDKLPAFDALDGTTDKVVHLCAGCDFSMDGKEQNPIEVGGYTLHFCNPNCAERFKTDTNKKLLALDAKKE